MRANFGRDGDYERAAAGLGYGSRTCDSTRPIDPMLFTLAMKYRPGWAVCMNGGAQRRVSAKGTLRPLISTYI
jgi:hypothetical protein